MSLIIIKDGEPISLFAKLGTADGSKYVRAILRYASGAPYSTPSVALAHVGEGLYTNNGVIFSGVNPLIASYQVFDDAGYSVRSSHYDDADIIIPISFGEVVRKDNFTAVLPLGSVTGVLPETKLSGVAFPEFIAGVLKSDNTLTGLAPLQNIQAEVKSCLQ